MRVGLACDVVHMSLKVCVSHCYLPKPVTEYDSTATSQLEKIKLIMCHVKWNY